MSDTGHGLRVEDADRGGRKFATKVVNVLRTPLGQLRGDDPAADSTPVTVEVAAFNASL